MRSFILSGLLLLSACGSAVENQEKRVSGVSVDNWLITVSGVTTPDNINFDFSVSMVNTATTTQQISNIYDAAFTQGGNDIAISMLALKFPNYDIGLNPAISVDPNGTQTLDVIVRASSKLANGASVTLNYKQAEIYQTTIQ